MLAATRAAWPSRRDRYAPGRALELARSTRAPGSTPPPRTRPAQDRQAGFRWRRAPSASRYAEAPGPTPRTGSRPDSKPPQALPPRPGSESCGRSLYGKHRLPNEAQHAVQPAGTSAQDEAGLTEADLE